MKGVGKILQRDFRHFIRVGKAFLRFKSQNFFRGYLQVIVIISARQSHQERIRGYFQPLSTPSAG